ncbi:metallophosphoesterase [Paenibacillus sp. JTLBN-2024]
MSSCNLRTSSLSTNMTSIPIPKLDAETKSSMEMVIREEQPDLIVFTGDVIASARTKDPMASFRKAVAVAENSRIPWAAVFGNHDSEGIVTRAEMHRLQLEHKYCVAKEDPPGISGAGNFTLTVMNDRGEAGAALYFLDSGDYSPFGGYDWIRRDQIDWYVSGIEGINRAKRREAAACLAFSIFRCLSTTRYGKRKYATGIVWTAPAPPRGSIRGCLRRCSKWAT